MVQRVEAAPTFQAVWNDQNVHLKEVERTLSQKIGKIAWDIFSIILFPIGIARAIGWAVGFVAKKAILPAAWFYPNQIIQRAKRIFNVCCRNLQNEFDIQKHKIVTPDGVKLNTIHFKHRHSSAETPTVLFFQSNASLSQLGIYLWLIEQSVERRTPCNFVVFDYRGVGSSKGDARAVSEFTIDGDTALQFVKDHLQVPPNKIHFYGWSLGGGIGTDVKALHPECTGPMVNERSFGSLKSVAANLIPTFLQPLFFWVPWASEKQRWNLEVPLQNLKGRTLIVFHRNDPTIPYPASAHAAALKAEMKFDAIELYQTEEQIAAAQEKLVDHHYEDLENYYSSAGVKAHEAIANYILPQQAE